MYLSGVKSSSYSYYILDVYRSLAERYDYNFNKRPPTYHLELIIDLKRIREENRKKYTFSYDNIRVYRIPRTLTIAYNETHLFSPDIRQNCALIYAALECKDPISIIADFLFELIISDYSLYKCANL